MKRVIFSLSFSLFALLMYGQITLAVWIDREDKRI